MIKKYKNKSGYQHRKHDVQKLQTQVKTLQRELDAAIKSRQEWVGMWSEERSKQERLNSIIDALVGKSNER
jgi:peptidoglycan hydrolase CwlO-like protein